MGGRPHYKLLEKGNKNMDAIIYYASVAALIFLLGVLIVPMLLGKKWRHDQMGWGYPDRSPMSPVEGDGFQPTYRCKFCAHKICQDSTGAWFHLTGSSV